MPWVSLNSGSGTEYIYYDTVAGRRYEFKVRARNVYGYGEYSEVLVVQTGDRPDTMPELDTRAVGSIIQITWDEPADNGYSVDDYDVEILNKATNRFSSVFEIVNDRGVRIRESLCIESNKQTVISSRECEINAQTLASSAYGYRSGDLLVGRIKAHNQMGWGDWSVPNRSGARVYDLVPFSSP
jgi:hypothetical protein